MIQHIPTFQLTREAIGSFVLRAGQRAHGISQAVTQVGRAQSGQRAMLLARAAQAAASPELGPQAPAADSVWRFVHCGSQP